MDGVEHDPIARSRAVQNIVMSISMIPDPITRTVYIGECSRSMGIAENILTLQVAKYAAERGEREAVEAQRRRNREAAGLPAEPQYDSPSEHVSNNITEDTGNTTDTGNAEFLAPYEMELVRYAVKYGMAYMCDCAIE